MTFRRVLTDPQGDIYEGTLLQENPPLATPRGNRPRVSFSNKDQVLLIPGSVNHSKNLTPKSTSQHLIPCKPTNSPTPSPRSSILKQKSSSCAQQEVKPTLNQTMLFAETPDKKLRQSAYSFVLKTIRHFAAIYPKDMFTLSQIANQHPFYSPELIILIQKLALDRKPDGGSKFCCFKKQALEQEEIQLFKYMDFLRKLSSDSTVLLQVESDFSKAFPLIKFEKTAATNEQKEHKLLAKPRSNK